MFTLCLLFIAESSMIVQFFILGIDNCLFWLLLSLFHTSHWFICKLSEWTIIPLTMVKHVGNLCLLSSPLLSSPPPFSRRPSLWCSTFCFSLHWSLSMRPVEISVGFPFIMFLRMPFAITLEWTSTFWTHVYFFLVYILILILSTIPILFSPLGKRAGSSLGKKKCLTDYVKV